MGCDIHMGVEVLKGEFWIPVVRFLDCDECGATGAITREHYESKVKSTSRCYWCKGTGKQSGFGDRNYDLFAILANVRNGSGFAGCDTGDAVVPIDEPRGLPEDCTFYEEDLGGDHSASWVSLAELLAFDWQGTKVRRGMVDQRQFPAFAKTGKPKEWCGDVSGGLVRVISNEEMATRLARELPDDGFSYYTRITWKLTHAESVGGFHSKFIPALERLAAERGVGPDGVRIVFNFDS